MFYLDRHWKKGKNKILYQFYLPQVVANLFLWHFVELSFSSIWYYFVNSKCMSMTNHDDAMV